MRSGFWDYPLAYVSASDGLYQGNIPYTATMTAGTYYLLAVTTTGSGWQTQITRRVLADYYRGA